MLEILKRLFSFGKLQSHIYFRNDEWRHFLAWQKENSNLLPQLPLRFADYRYVYFNSGDVKVEQVKRFGHFGFASFAQQYEAWRPVYQRDEMDRDMIIHSCVFTEGDKAGDELMKFCEDYLGTKEGEITPLEEWRLQQLEYFFKRYDAAKARGCRIKVHGARLVEVPILTEQEAEQIRSKWEQIHAGSVDRHKPTAVIYDEMEGEH